jgi:hypothetical protein
MKKVTIALALIVAGSAFGASLAIPWFVDNAGANSGVPAANGGTVGIVFLKNTTDNTITAYISYYNQGGDYLGPNVDPANPANSYVDGNFGNGKPTGNSFTIAPQSSLAFRPVACDPSVGTLWPSWNVKAGQAATAAEAARGQEGAQGVNVPDRPRSANGAVIPGSRSATTGAPVVDAMKNGSISITWEGTSTDLQGAYAAYGIGANPIAGSNVDTVTFGYGHLLPTGK